MEKLQPTKVLLQRIIQQRDMYFNALNTLKEKFKNETQSLKEKHAKEIAEIKAKYAGAEKQIEARDRAINELMRQMKELQDIARAAVDAMPEPAKPKRNRKKKLEPTLTEQEVNEEIK